MCGTEFERVSLAIISLREFSGADWDRKLSSNGSRHSWLTAICGTSSSPTSSLQQGGKLNFEAEAGSSELTTLVIAGFGLHPRTSCPAFWKALTWRTCWLMFFRLSFWPETWKLGGCCCCFCCCKCCVICSLIGGSSLVGTGGVRPGVIC